MNELPDFLQSIKGRVRQNVSLAKRCWFKVGGAAEFFVTPQDDADIAHIFQHKPKDMPLTILGVGSNLLVRDGGLDGITLRLGRQFAQIEVLDGCRIKAGAAAMDVNVARVACEAGISGLEFLVGIPGTIGGALRMNGGAYGIETKDVLIEATVIDEVGTKVAMHIAASNPLAIDKENIDKKIVDKELEIIKAEITNSGKPAEMAEKISKGKISKFLNDNSLLNQVWIMDPKKKVSDILKENSSDKAIRVLDFVRYKVGEGL